MPGTTLSKSLHKWFLLNFSGLKLKLISLECSFLITRPEVALKLPCSKHWISASPLALMYCFFRSLRDSGVLSACLLSAVCWCLQQCQATHMGNTHLKKKQALRGFLSSCPPSPIIHRLSYSLTCVNSCLLHDLTGSSTQPRLRLFTRPWASRGLQRRVLVLNSQVLSHSMQQFIFV